MTLRAVGTAARTEHTTVTGIAARWANPLPCCLTASRRSTCNAEIAMIVRIATGEAYPCISRARIATGYAKAAMIFLESTRCTRPHLHRLLLVVLIIIIIVLIIQVVFRFILIFISIICCICGFLKGSHGFFT